MTKPDLLNRYPFYSADSTMPIATVQYGSIIIPQDGVNTRRFMMEKQQAIKTKRFGVNQDRLDRLEAAIIEFKRIEQYFDELWSVRGITWPDHPWEDL